MTEEKKETRCASALKKFKIALETSASKSAFFSFAKCEEKHIVCKDGLAQIMNRAGVILNIKHSGYTEEGEDLFNISFVDSDDKSDISQEAFETLNIPSGEGLDENTLRGTLRSIKLPEDCIEEMIELTCIYAERIRRKQAKEQKANDEKEAKKQAIIRNLEEEDIPYAFTDKAWEYGWDTYNGTCLALEKDIAENVFVTSVIAKTEDDKYQVEIYGNELKDIIGGEAMYVEECDSMDEVKSFLQNNPIGQYFELPEAEVEKLEAVK